MYNSFLLDQSVALNRRRDEDVVEIDDSENEPKDIGYTKLTTTIDDKKDLTKIQPKDTIPRIFACATMWHETRVSFNKLPIHRSSMIDENIMHCF